MTLMCLPVFCDQTPVQTGSPSHSMLKFDRHHGYPVFKCFEFIALDKELLPPAPVGWGKVIVSLCLSAGGYSHHWTGVPPCSLGWGYPHLDGGLPPSLNGGYSPVQGWMGMPPCPVIGAPPTPCQGTYPPPRTCYTAGGMPLASTQEDFFA